MNPPSNEQQGAENGYRTTGSPKIVTIPWKKCSVTQMGSNSEGMGFEIILIC
jgi:hypothetical protein